MPKFSSIIWLVGAVCAAPWACSSSDPGTAGPGAGAAGAASGGAGVGGSGLAAGTSGADASAGGAGGNNGGAAGTPGGAGASGSNAGAGAPSCVPGTGTQDVGQQSVLDRKTCLTWTKTRTATTYTNKAAAKYCAALEQDGIGNWRVPRPEELVTWPDLATDGTAYITGPVYVPTASTPQDGCTGNSHSCNLAKYNDTSVTCAWQGVGFTGWVACVSGTPSPGSASAPYAASACSPCSTSIATFTETDCTQYTN